MQNAKCKESAKGKGQIEGKGKIECKVQSAECRVMENFLALLGNY
jgi:hypothetical protein